MKDKCNDLQNPYDQIEMVVLSVERKVTNPSFVNKPLKLLILFKLMLFNVSCW